MTQPLARRHVTVLAAFLAAAASGAGHAQAQEGPLPDPGGITAVSIVPENIRQEMDAVRARLEKFRAAGYPMPSIDDAGAYGMSTLIEANRRFGASEEDCTAALDLAMFLDAHLENTNLRDALGTVDRPLWMTRKVLATMLLPDKLGVSTSAMDALLGLKNRFSWIGLANNVYQSAGIISEHWDETARVQQGKWANAAYEEARRENWSEEDIAARIVTLQAKSEKLLGQVNTRTALFEGAVQAEDARHADRMSELDRIFEARMEAIAKDESEGGERRRREQWLRDNAHTGEPKPGAGVIIDPSRNPSEMSYEWAITETEPDGKYYREARAAALVDLRVSRAHEVLKHETALEALALDHGTDLNDLLREISALQVARDTLHTVNLPLALGKCEELARPGMLKEKLPEIGMETLLGLPHDDLANVLDHLGLMPPTEVMDCICRRANYGQSGTVQIYHPDTYGEYDPRYSCNRPGPPCIVSGFGCTRNPLPSDPAFWHDCAIGTDLDGKPADQAIIDALNAPPSSRAQEK